MPTFTVLPNGTYPIGTRNLGPTSIPTGLTKAVLSLAGGAMTDPALTVTLQLDLSIDGGATWASTNRGPATDPYPTSSTIRGGGTRPRGGAQTEYIIGAVLPDPTNPGRQMRGTLTIAGTPLTTTGTLTVT